MSTLPVSIAMAATLLAAPVLAQSRAAKDNAPVKTAHTVNDGGAMKGSNSFTEAQAREHIAKSGYSRVSALKKDANGIWRGTAMKNGRSVQVGLDFKGNVVAPE